MPKLLMATTVELTLEFFLLPVARHFQGLGWTVDAIAAGATTSASTRATFDEVFEARWTRRVADPRNYTVGMRDFRRVVTDGDYDLVHLHTPIAGLVGRFALRRRSRPAVVYTAHGFHFHDLGGRASNAVYRAVERRAARWTDDLLVMNQQDLDAALGFGTISSDRIHMVPGAGIDTAEWSADRVDAATVDGLRREWGIATGDRVVALVARLHPSKRHEVALEALALLDRTDLHLLLVGDGPRLAELQAMADERGLSDRVHFTGRRDDVAALMRAADFTISASEREGLSRTVLESMSLGVPVIGTDIRGVRDLIGGERGGRLVEVGDPAAMAQAMEMLLDDPELLQRLGEAGRTRARGFELSEVLRVHEEVYRRALGG